MIVINCHTTQYRVCTEFSPHLEVKTALQLSELIIKLLMTKLYLPLEHIIFLLPHISQVMQGILQVISKPLCTCKGIKLS